MDLPRNPILPMAVLWFRCLCFRARPSPPIRFRGSPRPLLGDALVIMATLFFALTNVGEEFCVKKKDLVEVISMMSISGLLVSICQIAIMERNSLESVKWSAEVSLAFAGYPFAAFLFYSFAPFVLKIDWLYYLAFGLVVIGLVVYSKTEKGSVSAAESEDGLAYEILDGECTDARKDNADVVDV
ncbi:unnamed protein product [Cuscuta epithymum]|uniref:WAT1-related protein n=1 Tax=Cuscuta epithymum TaxID=186058 RepID=A0AAV0CQ41_9ASTE|nr:unnamed protein product [Cuscuta epithymum]